MVSTGRNQASRIPILWIETVPEQRERSVWIRALRRRQGRDEITDGFDLFGGYPDRDFNKARSTLRSTLAGLFLRCRFRSRGDCRGHCRILLMGTVPMEMGPIFLSVLKIFSTREAPPIEGAQGDLGLKP